MYLKKLIYMYVFFIIKSRIPLSNLNTQGLRHSPFNIHKYAPIPDFLIFACTWSFCHQNPYPSMKYAYQKTIVTIDLLLWQHFSLGFYDHLMVINSSLRR